MTRSRIGDHRIKDHAFSQGRDVSEAGSDFKVLSPPIVRCTEQTR